MTKAMNLDEAMGSTGFVYIAQIGKHIKIGFSRNVAKRLKAVETSATQVDLLFSVPGDMRLEKLIHNLLGEDKIRNELFHQSWRITSFIYRVEQEGIAAGLKFLESSTPKRREQAKQEAREQRIKIARQTKSEKDAYFASLVAGRKQRIGW